MGREILDLPPPPADRRIAYGRHPLQFGELRMPSGPGPHPVAVVLHGGFWRARYDLAYIGHLCQALRATGICTWNVEYRRLDLDGGWPNTLLDVGNGVDFARTLAAGYPLDLSRVFTIGHSAGGHLALWSAARARIAPHDVLFQRDPLPLCGAIALAGVVDLRRSWELQLGDGVVDTFMGGSPVLHPDRYRTASPLELLPFGVRQVLVHGTEDETVPVALAGLYVEQARALGDEAQLVALAGDDHWAPVDPGSSAWPRVLEAARMLMAQVA